MSHELDNLEQEYYSYNNIEDHPSIHQENNHPIHETVNEYFHINSGNDDANNNNNKNNGDVSSVNGYDAINNNKQFEQLKSIKSGQYLSTNSDVTIPYYEENVVNVKEYYYHYFRKHASLQAAGQYFLSFFPIIKWLPHYNLQWLFNDVAAGITVGCVLVPQSMSYAKIASLHAQYGLYSSFVGAFIYCFFATSKDVCIGPVAVMSLQTAKAIANVLESLPSDTTITGPVIATVLSLYCGIIALGIGVLKLGFLVEFISITAVSGFMTGSAFTIIWGQVPSLLGYSKKVNTRATAYKVIIESLKHLPDTTIDSVFGIIPLVMLFGIKYFCGSLGPKLLKNNKRLSPQKKAVINKILFYCQTLRNAFVIILFTLISWGVWRSDKAEKISRLGKVPKGFKDVGLMTIPAGLSSKVAKELPASVIVLVLEHISISKAFGRVNDYRVVPDQELVAIGATNLIGTFFHAYPATGSFSRSALKAKCNVSTPLSGIFTGSCVVLALYSFTKAFYFIPNATLSAVIIHAVADLIASYKTTWNFYLTNHFDFVGFIVTVFLSVFSSLDNGIYFAMCWSALILLLKIAFPNGQFLGRVKIAEVRNPNVDFNSTTLVNENIAKGFASSSTDASSSAAKSNDKLSKNSSDPKEYINVETNSVDSSAKVTYYTKWVPFDHKYTRELSEDISVLPPPPGVIVFRPSESWTYVNCSRQYDRIFNHATATTKKNNINTEKKWNDPGEWTPPRFLKSFFKNKKFSDNLENQFNDERPVLKIVAFDFSSVTQIDTTGVQTLVDLRKALNKYANRQVEFHFCGIISPWIKRTLINSGFGSVNEEFSNESLIVGHTSYHIAKTNNDAAYEEYGAATGVNLPFFHIDIPDFNEWDI